MQALQDPYISQCSIPPPQSPPASIDRQNRVQLPADWRQLIVGYRVGKSLRKVARWAREAILDGDLLPELCAGLAKVRQEQLSRSEGFGERRTGGAAGVLLGVLALADESVLAGRAGKATLGGSAQLGGEARRGAEDLALGEHFGVVIWRFEGSRKS